MEPAADVVICLDKTEGLRNWKGTKIKEGEAIGEKLFRLAQIDLGLDGYGQPVTSVAIAPEEPGAPFAPPRRYPTTSNQRIAWDAVGKALVESVELGRADAPVYRPCITLTAAHAAAAACMSQTTGRDRNLAARRAIDAMTANGVFAVKDGWLWLP